MYEESNRQLYQDNWDSTKATTKRDGFTNFLERLSNQFFFFNLQNCYPFKAKAFNFKVKLAQHFLLNPEDQVHIYRKN